MDTEKYQKELFEFEPPKKAAPRFGNIFQGTDFAIVLTPEKLVFLTIGIIMLMVVFFALGVEKGRSIADSKVAAVKTIADNTTLSPAIPVRPIAVKPLAVKPVPAPVTVSKSTVAPKVASKVEATTPAAVKVQPVTDKTKPYMVVVAAYSRADFAAKEVDKLKMAGLDAFVHYRAPYYQVCVGAFPNKDGAQNTLNKVKQMHKDAYVKSR